MQATLPEPLVSRLSDFVAERTGLQFPRERWADFERKIAAAAEVFGKPNAESCARWLLSAPLTRGQFEILASHLTVGETYFFRERRSFEALETQVLPALIRARHGEVRRLRIWSAGCSTGEEAYSVAILLDRLIPDIVTWTITILATDINPQFLRKAAEGVYGEWSFRDPPAWLRERYFRRGGNGRFELDGRIRGRVTFSYLNLAEDLYPSLVSNTNAMDVILCRNVLMYFTPAQARKVADNLYRSLVHGGWLIVSPAEASSALFSGFMAVECAGATLYRKTVGEQQRASSEAWPPTPPPEVSLPPPPFVPPNPASEPAAPSVAPMGRTPGPVWPEGAETGAAPHHLDEPSAWSRVARACADQGRLSEAIDWCEKAITADKLNPAHQYLLAAIQREQGQGDDAARSLTRALYLDPDFALAHFALGNLRLSQGRGREAERHFDNALALLQRHPQDEILPEAEGLTAGRLGEIIVSVRSSLPRPPVAAA
jgi:chemotaxis protein methyltransferase CheR